MPTTQSSGSVEELKIDAISALRSADTSDQLEAWRVEYLGRKGRLTSILRDLGSLDIDQRKVVGFTDSLIRLFGIPGVPVSVARGIGLAAFDMAPGAKQELARQTMGLSGRLSRLARGLRL